MNNTVKKLELMDVEYDGSKKVIFTFLDEETSEIAEVNWNKQVWDADKNSFVDSPEKEKQVDDWCVDYMGVTFDKLESKVGETFEVYCYDKFNSLWEVEIVNKFSEDDIGEIFQTTIDEIEDNNVAILIKYKYNDQPYQSKMQHAKWIESKKSFMQNPTQRAKVLEKFEAKFGVPFSEKGSLVGKTITVEVKKFGQYPYGEVKPLKKAKKTK